jgi:AcrR family transcriptional regulator
MAIGERKSEQTRARILAAASALFARDGFEGTSTRSIAAAAGVAHGTIFRYAPTKEDLVELLFAERIGTALANAAASAPAVAEGGSFTDLAMHFYGAFFGAYAVDADLARVLVKELPFLHGAPQERQQLLTAVLFAHLGADVEARQQRGEFDADAVPMVLVSASFALYFSALVAWLSAHVDKDGARDLLLAQHRLLERGVKTTAPPTTTTTPPDQQGAP